MKYKVSIRGKEYEVEVKDNIAKVNRVDINFKENNEGILINEKLYKVEIQDANTVKINEELYNFKIKEEKEIEKTIEKKIEEKEKATSLKGGIYPPMPGKIISVKVKNGDKVKRGQLLLILEAMKMQNEIRAVSEGVVKEVKVKQGDSVSANDVLVVID